MVAHRWWHFARMPWTTLLGVGIGVIGAFALPDVLGPLRAMYDLARPVLRMNGMFIERDGVGVTLHIKGEKLRGEECRLVAVYGYSVDAEGRLSDARASRVDRTIDDRMRDAGLYDIGLWRVVPVGDDAVSVRVLTQHDCLGRAVLSTIADVGIAP